MKLLRRLKEEQLNDARAREDAAKLALKERGKELQEKLNALNFPHGSASDGRRPCESFREAITTCYRANGKENPLACTGEVEAFAECARQLSKISNL